MINKSLKFFIFFFFLVVLFFNFSLYGEDHFLHLAISFLHGKLYFLDTLSSWSDTVQFSGKHYWPLAPFPAILLIPFEFIYSLLGGHFLQGHLQFFLVVGVFYLVYKIALFYKYSKEDSLYWAFAFCFSSAFIGVATLS